MTDEEVQQRIGRRIRACRLEGRLTQQQLAAALGLTRASVSNIEAGTQALTLLGFLKIAQELEVRPGDLLDAVTEGVRLESAASAAGLPDTYQSWLHALKHDDATFDGAAV